MRMGRRGRKPLGRPLAAVTASIDFMPQGDPRARGLAIEGGLSCAGMPAQKAPPCG